MNKKIYFNFIKPYISKYLILFGIVVVSTLVSLYQPIIFKQLLDVSLYSKKTNILIQKIILFIVIFIVCQLMYFFQNTLATKINEGILYDIRSKVFKSILFKPIIFFDKQGTGESMNIILSEIPSIINFLLGTSLKISSNAISILASTIIMLSLDIEIAIWVIISSIVSVFVIKKQNKIINLFEQKLLNINIDISNSINELLSNINTIKHLNLYKFSINRFKKPNKEHLRNKIEYAYKFSKMQVLLSTVYFIPNIILMSYGMYRVSIGKISIGTVVAISGLLGIFMESIKKLHNINTEYQQFLIMSNRLMLILDNMDNCNDSKGKVINKPFSIQIKDISYESADKVILNKLNYNIKLGKIVHISGGNGSGKSSLVNILSGVFKPSNGKILFEEINICDIDRDEIKKLVGIVPQQIQMFSGTVKENILLDREFSDSEIKYLIDNIGFYEIEKLLDKKIHENGTNLSGGQKQKIAILRALISNPYILILDEASSALDKKSKNSLYKYIYSIKSEKIIFIISHDMDIDSDIDIMLDLDIANHK